MIKLNSWVIQENLSDIHFKGLAKVKSAWLTALSIKKRNPFMSAGRREWGRGWWDCKRSIIERNQLVMDGHCSGNMQSPQIQPVIKLYYLIISITSITRVKMTSIWPNKNVWNKNIIWDFQLKWTGSLHIYLIGFKTKLLMWRMRRYPGL